MTAALEHKTIVILARLAIVNAIAITDAKAVACAVAPNRVLNESRETLGKADAKASHVNMLADLANDLAASRWLVACRAIEVLCTKVCQYAGSMQEVMNERIDSDHPGAGRHPMRKFLRAGDQQR